MINAIKRLFTKKQIRNEIANPYIAEYYHDYNFRYNSHIGNIEQRQHRIDEYLKEGVDNKGRKYIYAKERLNLLQEDLAYDTWNEDKSEAWNKYNLGKDYKYYWWVVEADPEDDTDFRPTQYKPFTKKQHEKLMKEINEAQLKQLEEFRKKVAEEAAKEKEEDHKRFVEHLEGEQSRRQDAIDYIKENLWSRKK